MKKFFVVLTFLILMIIQTTWVDLISIWNVVPNFLFVFTVLYSLRSSPVKAGIMGGLCGIIFDVSGSSVFGFNTLLMIYIASGAFMISEKFYCDNIFVTSGVVFALSLIFEIFKITVYSVFFHYIDFTDLLFRFTLLECFLNVFTALILFGWVKWLSNEYIKGL